MKMWSTTQTILRGSAIAAFSALLLVFSAPGCKDSGGGGAPDTGGGGPDIVEPQPVKRFELAVGGPAHEAGRAVQQISDGGYIACGQSESTGDTHDDAFLFRATREGELVWKKWYGGTGIEFCHSVVETPDHGFLLVGTTTSTGAGLEDVYIIRTDGDGTMVWEKTIGGAGNDAGFSVMRAIDGGYLIAGDTFVGEEGDSNVLVAKLDEDGALVWQKTYGGELGDFGRKIIQTFDRGLIVAGYTFSSGAGSTDGYLLRLNNVGDLLWEKTYGSAEAEYIDSAALADDGGFVLVGYQWIPEEEKNGLFAVKTDAGGNQQWARNYHAGRDTYGHGAIAIPGDGFLFVGHISSRHEDDVFLLRTDAMGRRIFRRPIGGNQSDEAINVAPTDDGGFIIVGDTSSYGAGDEDMYLLKTDRNGFSFE